MPEIYAKLFDLIKDTTRYFYFQDDYLYLKLVELSKTFNSIYTQTVTQVVDKILEDTGNMVDTYQDLAY
jgi:hypothetical protein